ncbi:nitrate reductase cytochrome c-type subunit [Shewanella eurypsychrophilus]|uniref:Periplasmic nitrate reductase, electron transfer subunit n=1 Tax=Shewanella eurypsychrophilus TaxID=2593656 RepID=A0ABX6V250_9GAMM|nr:MULTISPECIES: nitrate reductase cytochrome c-type subunit [Shewanella]QFU21317.1 nitrate reductase cytochrome c-type subunit; periplasmic nitrate reductase electron transfer subunit [Shewanella sp. YLB-09]QPG56607.1 nitrate reductase cytochrome c-type subunit [Shewanella eurypsychrophilus]
MKKVLTLAALVMALSACSGQQANTSAEPVNVSSLGKSEISEVRAADAMPIYPKRGKSIERDFVHQPPMIPHKADYKITMKRNGCMSCHSWDKAKKRKATPIDISHVKDDKGTLNGQYYSCTQCHAPQAENKQQLVENDFSNK